MTDLFFQMGLSNACFALALAIVAMVVGATTKRPHLAHMLWLLVFVKLVTPPIVPISVVTIPKQPETAVAVNNHSRSGLPVASGREFDVAEQPDTSPLARIKSMAFSHGKEWLPPIWLLGSVVVFAWSLVRWIEWLSCVCFWWNSVVWWAQRNLRATEEICCDSLVLSCRKPKPHAYANSLLTAVECFACPVLRPPAMASEINSGGFLERRFRMIVSETPNRVHSRRLKWLVLLFAVVVLPLGAARAEDDKARTDAYLKQVRAKLKAAIAAGEMSAEDARAKIRAIKKAKMGDGKKDIDFDAIGEKIRAAEKAGKLTEEQARAKMGAIKRAKLGDGKKDTDYKAIGERIKAAVAAGKLTEEEAWAKWAAIKKAAGAKKDQQPDRAREYLMKVRKELGAGVEAGRISEEDAKKRYQGAQKAIKERMAAGRSQRGSRRITREDYGREEAELRKLVAEGRISGEDARARLGAMRRMIGEQSEGATRKIDWEGIRRRIEGAVERGDMTREEADAKYREIRERMAGRRDR